MAKHVFIRKGVKYYEGDEVLVKCWSASSIGGRLKAQVLKAAYGSVFVSYVRRDGALSTGWFYKHHVIGHAYQGRDKISHQLIRMYKESGDVQAG